jgi:hypothetical protein
VRREGVSRFSDHLATSVSLVRFGRYTASLSLLMSVVLTGPSPAGTSHSLASSEKLRSSGGASQSDQNVISTVDFDSQSFALTRILDVSDQRGGSFVWRMIVPIQIPCSFDLKQVLSPNEPRVSIHSRCNQPIHPVSTGFCESQNRVLETVRRDTLGIHGRLSH